MARPRKRDDDEILAVAREVFLEHGPASSLASIAERLGMSQPALSKRFGSKEALMLQALGPPDDLPWMASLLAGPDARPLPEQLEALCAGAMTLMATAVPGILTLRASGMDLSRLLQAHPDAPPLRARRALADFFARARERGLVRDLEPDRMADLLVGALEARALMAHLLEAPLRPEAVASEAASLVDLLWRGIAPTPPERAT